VEPLFAEAKAWHGLRRFRLRTLLKVNSKSLVIATGQNLKRLLNWGLGTARMAKRSRRTPNYRGNSLKAFTT